MPTQLAEQVLFVTRHISLEGSNAVCLFQTISYGTALCIANHSHCNEKPLRVIPSSAAAWAETLAPRAIPEAVGCACEPRLHPHHFVYLVAGIALVKIPIAILYGAGDEVPDLHRCC